MAEQGGEVRLFGEVGGERSALLKTVRKLTSRGGELVFVYEAGPCGFWIATLQRYARAMGYRVEIKLVKERGLSTRSRGRA